jgi:thioredoxin-related protein
VGGSIEKRASMKPACRQAGMKKMEQWNSLITYNIQHTTYNIQPNNLITSSLKTIFMKCITLLLLMVFPFALKSQEPVKIYNPDADAGADLEQAIQTAKDQNKHILVQVGGNWCPWCVKLHGFFASETKVDSILKADYVLVRVNYSKENKNPEVMASLGYPQRFGFPVLLVLDQGGKHLHTQDTGYLELDKGYDPEKVSRFLLNWNVTAINPESYR